MAVEILNIDCMEYMARQPDNAFDLAIVDPPYGINAGNMNMGKKKGTRRTKLRDTKKNWDSLSPTKEYFSELLRVSQNQIVWGGNHMMTELASSSPCWIVWDKQNDGLSFAEAELAWTSFTSVARVFRMRNIDPKAKINKIHPTQKPIRLYQWLLTRYAKPGQRILDTHLGSGSSAIAAYYYGCNFVGCEIDKDYVKGAKNRFDHETSQAAMF